MTDFSLYKLTARVTSFLAGCILIMAGTLSSVQAETLEEALSRTGATVIFLRHALAPGFGDPASFRLDDCTTQRNLSQEGIEQAQELGQLIRNSAIIIDNILSSKWCRCVDTAQHLNLGPFETFDGLNSFYQGHADRNDTMNLLRQKLNSLTQNRITLMVTHQVVISAATGLTVPSGGMVLFSPETGEAVRFSF